MAKRKPRVTGNPTHDEERCGSELILADLTKEIESKFKHVVIPEPAPFVSMHALRLVRTPDQAIVNYSIPFVRGTSGSGKEGESDPLYPTAAQAIAAWETNIKAYLAGRPEAETLFWRVRPEIDRGGSFETGEFGWQVYSRLAVN